MVNLATTLQAERGARTCRHQPSRFLLRVVQKVPGWKVRGDWCVLRLVSAVCAGPYIARARPLRSSGREGFPGCSTVLIGRGRVGYGMCAPGAVLAEIDTRKTNDFATLEGRVVVCKTSIIGTAIAVAV